MLTRTQRKLVVKRFLAAFDVAVARAMRSLAPHRSSKRGRR